MKIQPRALIPSAVACLLLVAALVAPSLAAAKSKRPPPRPLYWGAQIGKQLTGEQAPWDMEALYAFERLARKKVSLLSFASAFTECGGGTCTFSRFPTAPFEAIRANGAIPFFSWNTGPNKPGAQQPAFKLARFIDGTYDVPIREFAEAAHNWGHPFFLRLDWEMNGFWFPWSEGVNSNRKGEFAAAWRHIHNIFTSVGATNATWVWCPNVDFTRKLVPLKGLYPGDAYVDWTCLDGFNWGKTKNSAGWQNFNQIFHSTYKRVLRIAPSKPLIIGEVASEERGGSKARWIKNLLNVVPSKYRRIRGIIWYEQKDQGRRWPIESSGASRRSFAHWIQKRVYQANRYRGLRTSGPIRPPSW